MLIGIVGLAASRLGELWVGFDVFSQLTLQFAVMTAAFAIGFAMPRARVLAAVVLMLLGALLIGLWPQWASRNAAAAAPATPPPDTVELKLASFNVWDGNTDTQAIHDELIRLDADIVGVVEVRGRGQDIADSLRTQYPYHADCFDDPWCDTIILSKRPIVSRQYKLFWEGPPMMAAHFGPELGGLTVVAAHTLRFPHSRAQLTQIQALGKWLETVPGRKILMGDFNATPFSRMLTAVEGGTGLRRLTELPTWPSWVALPQVAIDHIFAAPDIAVVRGESIGNPAGSDHFPISMTVAVPAR